MIARLSSYEGPAKGVDDFVRGMEQNTEALLAMPGFQGAYMLVDPDAGTALTLTLWASRSAEAESATTAARWRKDAADATHHQIRDVRVYEVAVQVKGRAG
jgi:heme-degrading monooxygenase HmoA